MTLRSTLRLRGADGRPTDVGVRPRRPVVIGVALTGDLATDVRRAVRADVVRRAVEHRRGVGRVVALGAAYDPLVSAVDEVGCRPLEAALAGVGLCDVVVGDAAARVVACVPSGDGEPLPDARGLVLRHTLLGGSDVGEVERWQRAVAEWAESASEPMCAAYVARAEEAADDDADTASILDALRELEADPVLAPGGKFETFAHLDALVGLDLSSRVGQPR